ncbi:hypothetical protein SAMN04244553_3583 [Nocardia amikacinitolerans]|uniref:Uncharacterized protein n=1 Tax=Nocardia amikacinitolerans TaxID=756689 RepID=A0A285LGA0_9NOCA|nr:hypothetical protein SAMN04244553_3583 [Nocardia amikacinitolerans]
MDILHQGQTSSHPTHLVATLSAADRGKAWSTGRDLYIWDGATLSYTPDAIG